MESYISRAEHNEFVRRMEDEHSRQNERIENLETTVKGIGELAQSVSRLATNMENMLKEQKNQGKRLDELEGVPANNWNTLKVAMLSAIGGALGTAIIAAIANFI